MLATGHPHAPRVIKLLQAARDEVLRINFQPFGAAESLVLEVVLYAPVNEDPWDATNYLGGIGDVLEQKSRRGTLDHLGELASVHLYPNDRQIHEVHYQQEPGREGRYTVRVRNRD